MKYFKAFIVLIFVYIASFQHILAQVVVDSQPYTEEIFTEQAQVDPSLSLFLWFLFAVSFISFLIFWFNREYLLFFLGWGKNNLEIDFQDFEENQNQHSDIKFTSVNEAENGKEFTSGFSENNNSKDVFLESAVHDISVEDSSSEYKKPKLKLIIEDDNPKLVFE